MKIDKKTKYTIAALIGLLFVVTIVHSVAILNITDDGEQGAQVVRSGGDAKIPFNCLVVNPASYNQSRITSTNDTLTPNFPDRSFSLSFSVMNQCQYDIKLIDTSNLIGQTTIASSVQKEFGFGAPINVNVLGNNLGIQLGHEVVWCLDCDNGGAPTYYASPEGDYNNLGVPSVRGYTISAGETNMVMIETKVRAPALSNDFIRVAPVMLKWFSVSALSDNVVTALEMKTYNFSAANSNNWASDYTKLFYY